MTNRGRKSMMPSFKSILLAGAAAMLPFAAPAHAAPEEAPVAEAVAAPEAETAEQFDSEASAEAAKAKMQREMDEAVALRSEEHTSELQSLMRNSYAVFCLKKKKNIKRTP